MKKEIVRYSAILILVILIGLFVYPTVYKYDKLEQKYPVRINRITGNTEVLRNNGWIDVDATQSEIDKVRSEVDTDFKEFKKQLTQEVINSVKTDVVNSLQKDISASEKRIRIV